MAQRLHPRVDVQGRAWETYQLDRFDPLEGLERSGEREVHRPSGIQLAAVAGPGPLAAMDVFGVPVNVAPPEAVCAWLLEAARVRGRVAKVVHFAGAGSLGRAWKDVAHRSRLARGDLVLGEGVTVGAYALLASIPSPSGVRFDAVATLSRVFEAAGRSGQVLRVFLFGGERGRAERAARTLEARFPGVRVVGAADGRHGVEDVNEACADVLLVGGTNADAWVDDNLELLDVGVVASVGDAIDALGGDGCRAPRATPPMGILAAISFLVRATLYIGLRVRPRAPALQR